MKKTFCIGDIHGAHKALVQVLERSGFDYENDTLITLGDIADGWPEVDKCVNELLSIKNRVDIMGNHDEWFHRYLRTFIHPDWWQQGGKGTFDSYDLGNGGEVTESHREFFLNQISYHIDSENRLFVHGGIDPMMPIEKQSRIDLCWDRDLWDSVKSVNTPPNAPIVRTIDGFTKIFIGHTSLRGMTPLKFAGVWNLDTGAGWHGKLTIMNVDTEEYWQSDNVKTLYPNIAGR